jgi:imidazolonepropionase-like amidohydrolase
MLAAGVDDIAHLAWDPIPPHTIRQMVDAGVYLIPTFTVFRNYTAPLGQCIANLKAYVEAGGLVALGNDYGGGPGDFETGIPMYEIEMMQKAGMSSMQIIQASTKNAAVVLGLENEIGTLEIGKQADILIISGNPLEDLSTLKNLKVVVHAGQPVPLE